MSPAAFIRFQMSIDASIVVGVGGADEPVEGDVELLLQRWNTSELRRASSAVGMPSRGGGLRHLQAVHVGAGEEADVEAVEPLEPRDRVGGDVLVGVPDVRRAVRVVDRRGDVERARSFGHSPYCVAVSSQALSRTRGAAAAGAARPR